MEKELSTLRKKYLDQKDPVVQQLQLMVDSFAKSQQQILQANQELIQRTINQQMEAYHANVQVAEGDSFFALPLLAFISCLVSFVFRGDYASVRICPYVRQTVL